MKKILIPAAVIIVLVGGYFIYQAFFTYTPSYSPAFTKTEQPKPPSPATSETVSSSSKYSKFAGDWLPEKSFSPREPYYLHIELDSFGNPKIEVKVLEGYSQSSPPYRFSNIRPLDDNTVSLKLDFATESQKQRSLDIVFKYLPAVDKLEASSMIYRDGKKVGEDKEILLRKGTVASESALIQSKVRRARSSMRSMATAIEAYHVDNNRYPASVPGNHPLAFNKSPATQSMPSIRLGEFKNGAIIPLTLTTPIAYITKYPEDPFQVSPTDPQPTFSYYDSYGWILISPGPDGDYDINIYNDYITYFEHSSPGLLLKAYDPTNGTISDGDIFRMRQ